MGLYFRNKYIYEPLKNGSSPEFVGLLHHFTDEQRHHPVFKELITIIVVGLVKKVNYGPDKAFRKHVTENPASWKTTYREAKGNDLKVNVEGGTLLRNYPIIIKTDNDEVTIDIEGGIGAVPIRFENLKSADVLLFQVINGKELKLDQSVHGNDFWQTDYDALTNPFKVTFNLQLDYISKFLWILRAN